MILVEIVLFSWNLFVSNNKIFAEMILFHLHLPDLDIKVLTEIIVNTITIKKSTTSVIAIFIFQHDFLVSVDTLDRIML